MVAVADVRRKTVGDAFPLIGYAVAVSIGQLPHVRYDRGVDVTIDWGDAMRDTGQQIIEFASEQR